MEWSDKTLSIKEEFMALKEDIADLKYEIRKQVKNLIWWNLFFSLAYVVAFLLMILFIANK